MLCILLAGGLVDLVNSNISSWDPEMHEGMRRQPSEPQVWNQSRPGSWLSHQIRASAVREGLGLLWSRWYHLHTPMGAEKSWCSCKAFGTEQAPLQRFRDCWSLLEKISSCAYSNLQQELLRPLHRTHGDDSVFANLRSQCRPEDQGCSKQLCCASGSQRRSCTREDLQHSWEICSPPVSQQQSFSGDALEKSDQS